MNKSNGNTKALTSFPSYIYPWSGKSSSKHTIGVINPCYGASHVIFPFQLENYEHRRLHTFDFDFLNNKSSYYKNTPIILGGGVDIVHTWNAIPRNKPFIASFELEIPRFLGATTELQVIKGLKDLSSDRCLGITTLSEYGRRHAVQHFEKLGFGDLSKKISVLRGVVPDTSHSNLKSSSDQTKPLKAIIVGTDLFRKGVTFAVDAIKLLRKQGIAVELTVIGRLEEQSYIFRELIPSKDKWLNILNNTSGVSFYEPQPMDLVHRAILEHDLVLCPSLDESLGWLPIEAAMLQRPVFGTSMGAFPEFIKHHHTGGVSEIPVDENNRWLGDSLKGHLKKDCLSNTSQVITNDIVKFISDFAEKREQLKTLGKNGRELVLGMYGEDAYRPALESLYDEAFKSIN